MASQVLSGAANASYTNNTGQNVRLIINYMQNVTRMTWAGVTVNAESTTIGKDIQNIAGEFRSAVIGKDVYNVDVRVGSGVGPGVTRANEIKLSSEKSVFAYSTVGGGFSVGPTTLSTLKKSGTDAFFNQNVVLRESLGGDILNGRIGYSPYNLGKGFSGAGAAVGDSTLFGGNLFYVPTTISRGGNFPVELMLAPNQGFSAVCGAFNAIVIKEDGT